MYNQIRKMMKEELSGINARILFGTVKSVNPLKVMVDQRFILPEELLIIPNRLQQKKLESKDWKYLTSNTEVQRDYILQPALQEGDTLIIINLAQKYLIVDKVGDINENIIITQE